MPFTVQDLLCGIVVPAVAAMLLTVAGTRWCRRNDLVGFADAVAVTVGFSLGYWLLKLGPIVPKLDRDWVPYTAWFALIPAAIPVRRGSAFFVKACLLLAVVAWVGWLLVPTWPSLEPSRTTYLATWTIYTFAVALGLLLIARAELQFGDAVETNGINHEQSTGPVAWGGLIWLAMLAGVLGTAAALLALSGSLRFAQIASAGMAALIGLGAGLWFFSRRSSVGGVVLVYALLTCGALLTGKVNSFSSIPTTSYLLLPLAPLAYGITLRDGSSGKRTLLSIGIAVAVCALAMGLALAAEFGSE